ncbi:MAG: thio(seleno)oxazole modification radical SAM maturase SbtM [Spirochaetota bacterium]
MSEIERVQSIFPVTLSLLGNRHEEMLTGLAGELDEHSPLETFIHLLQRIDAPGYLNDLARLELVYNEVRKIQLHKDTVIENFTINPSLKVIELQYTNLHSLLLKAGSSDADAPAAGRVIYLVLVHPENNAVRVFTAENTDLLAMKILEEGLDPDRTARQFGIATGEMDRVFWTAADRGVLIEPSSEIRRSFKARDENNKPVENVSDFFTIQWHITQVCDMHCRHCYDRSDRSPLTLERGIEILDELRLFCKEKKVRGQITFTGGNPLMHPDFFSFYREAAHRGFTLAILGNPASRETIQKIMEIQKPVLYQVSLEGQREHNDYIRGTGSYQRAIDFLQVLSEFAIQSSVMLTLTAHNVDQVIPLARELQGKADAFTYNRLAPFGEGSRLLSVAPERYHSFLHEYLEEARSTPVMGLKDNLLNIELSRNGMDTFGGCAGYGCGAAFNFVALLPDGEVHACRKFPSMLGNINETAFSDIYDSTLAEQYRRGPEECADCSLAPVCRGCPAVASGMGKDIFREKDPYCFMSHLK